MRDAGKYLKARDLFRTCARETCPVVVRRDCAKWLPEMEDAVPTVVLVLHDARGADVSDAKVTVDGDTVATSIDGRPLALDPGPHDITFEVAGRPPVTSKFVLRAGDKNRPVSATLQPEAPVPQAASTTIAPSTDRSERGGIPTASYVLGGVGLAALGSFAVFGITGKGDLSTLRTTCAPHCATSDLDAAKTKLVIADVSLGIGLVALGVATYLALTNRADARMSGALPTWRF